MCALAMGIMTALGGYMNYRQQQDQAAAQAAAYQQQAENYRAQAEADKRNAEIENRKQEQIADNYAQQQKALRAKHRLQEGALRAQVGSSGLDFSGSAMDILSSSYDAYREDQINLLANQRNDNYSSRIAESNYIHQANVANANAMASSRAASNVKRAAKRAGIGTLLGTAANVYGVMGGGFGGGGGRASTTTSTFTTPKPFYSSKYFTY